MRFSTVAVVASVIAAVSALEYPFKPNGPCVDNCLETAGKEMYADFTSDPNNPHFIESLSYAHDRNTPKYTTYMTKAGMCMTKCPKPELDLYNQQNLPKYDWYQANKNGAATTGAPSTASVSPSTASVSPSAGASKTSGSVSTASPTASPTNKPNGAAGISASGALLGAAAFCGAVAALF